MTTLAVQDVKKDFGATKVLKDIDMEIGTGDFLVLVGPSGCGKSTLLNIIAGLEKQTSGEILIAGKDVSHLEPKARDIAMVFQSYALYPHMSVRDNMGFSLKTAGAPKAEIKRAASMAKPAMTQIGSKASANSTATWPELSLKRPPLKRVFTYRLPHALRVEVALRP